MTRLQDYGDRVLVSRGSKTVSTSFLGGQACAQIEPSFEEKKLQLSIFWGAQMHWVKGEVLYLVLFHIA